MALAATAETVLNSNLAASTRQKILKSVKRQVFMKNPLLARMLLSNRMTWQGGLNIARPVDMAEADSIVQAYNVNDGLTAERKTYLEKPWFELRYAQIPLVYDIEEKLKNMSGGSDTQILNFASFLANKGMRGLRIYLTQCMYEIPSEGTTQVTASDAKATQPRFQSAVQALNHDVTYGHLSRATTVTNKWWQGASVAEDYADDATDIGWSINTLRQMRQAVDLYADGPQDLLCVMGDTGHLKIKRELEGKHTYIHNAGPLANFGFNSFVLDGMEVVQDSWLRHTKVANAHKWCFIFNVNDWELWLHPDRAFEVKPYVHQAMVPGGPDHWLSRIFLAGNFVCWKPNGSIWLSALT